MAPKMQTGMAFLQQLNERFQFWQAQQTRRAVWDANLQLQIGERLRQLTINHLQCGNGVIAKGFRSTYDELSGFESMKAELADSRDAFLERQRQGTFATSVELTALGELLDVNIIVRPITAGVEGEPFCLNHVGDDKPTIRIFNSDNVHFHFDRDGSKTSGRGNSCLYHSVIQALQAHAQPSTPKPAAASTEVALKSETRGKVSSPVATSKTVGLEALTQVGTFKADSVTAAYLQQETRALEAAKTSQQEYAQAHGAWVASMRSMQQQDPAQYQVTVQQIMDDHKLCLRLASEEGSFVVRQEQDYAMASKLSGLDVPEPAVSSSLSM